MNKGFTLISLLIGLLMAAAGCSSGGGGAAAYVPPVEPGQNSIVYSVLSSAPTASCPEGGVQVDAGIDTNSNGTMDQSEVTSTQFVCNGAKTLVSIVSEPSGTNCPAGGKKVNVGIDSNANNTLEQVEVTHFDYVCNGADGADGRDSLIVIVPEAPSIAHCPNGGLKVTAGLDANSNGILDEGEDTSTEYACNGPQSVNIQSITAVPLVIRPGESTTLTVTASDGIGSSFTCTWSAAQGSFSNVNANPVTWTAPDAAGSYLLNVQVSNGASVATGYISVLASVSPTQSIITSVTPLEARSGDEITIIGAGFGPAQGTSTVTIGSQPTMTITSWTDTRVKAIVPGNAVSGDVVITVSGVDSSPGTLSLPWTEGDVQLVNVGGNQSDAQVASDGKGGAFVLWKDARSSGSFFYMQRVNRVGLPQWQADGIPLSWEAIEAYLLADGAGGAFVASVNALNGNIVVSRVNSSGTFMWNTTVVVPSVIAQTNLRLTSDGAGGVIVVWEDRRSPWPTAVYAQRVNSSGSILWTSNGVAIATDSTSYMTNPAIIPDGSSGAIITWVASKSGNYGIYLKKVNSSGVAQWQTLASPEDAVIRSMPLLVPDGSGGAVVSWVSGDIYAQRVDAAGSVLWAAGGAVVSDAANAQQNARMISLGDGSAIITWEDKINSSTTKSIDIYAQKMNADGTAAWTANGIVVSDAEKDQTFPQIVADDAGGAIIVWADYRSGSWDIYAQRINGLGEAQWEVNGAVFAQAASSQRYPSITSDGTGGVIAAFTDFRNVAAGNSSDIYVQRLDASGKR